MNTIQSLTSLFYCFVLNTCQFSRVWIFIQTKKKTHFFVFNYKLSHYLIILHTILYTKYYYTLFLFTHISKHSHTHVYVYYFKLFNSYFIVQRYLTTQHYFIWHYLMFITYDMCILFICVSMVNKWCNMGKLKRPKCCFSKMSSINSVLLLFGYLVSFSLLQCMSNRAVLKLTGRRGEKERERKKRWIEG